MKATSQIVITDAARDKRRRGRRHFDKASLQAYISCKPHPSMGDMMPPAHPGNPASSTGHISEWRSRLPA